MSRLSVRDSFAVTHPKQVWLITLAHGVNEFYSVALPPILPLIIQDFGITYGKAGALLTVFFAMYSIFQLPAGMLADRIGQTKLLAGGMVVLGVGLLIVANATNYYMLVFGQVIAGIGGSTYHPSGMSLISDLEAGATEGRAMGIHGLGGVVGMALAPALIGGLASVLDWRTALTTGASVGVVYALLFLLLFSLPNGNESETSVSTDGGSKADGVRERVRELVAVPLTLWVTVLFIASFLIALATGAVRTFAPSYLYNVLSESTTLSNSVYFAMLVGAGGTSIGSGYLADQLNRSRLVIGILVLSTLVLTTTALVPTNPVVLALWFFVLGLVLFAAFPVVNSLTSAYSEKEFSGSLFGIMLSASSLGGAVGPLIFGVAAERFGMVAAFPLIAGVFVLAILPFLLVLRK